MSIQPSNKYPTRRKISLDYTLGSVNFRDVGEFVNLIADEELMKEQMLFRGGKTDFCESPEDIGSPGTIINLRKGADKKLFGAEGFHFPISNDHEKYDVTIYEVRMWLNEIFRLFENPELEQPIFIHCLSGKDRTGIVVGTLLLLIGIPEQIIMEEYLLSDGDVHPEMFEKALNNIQQDQKYFNRIDLEKVLSNLKTWCLANESEQIQNQ